MSDLHILYSDYINPARNKPAPLLLKYRTECQEQPSFIALDCDDAEMRGGYQGDIGYSMPVKVFHGRERRWDVNPYISRDALDRLLDELAPLARRILAGYECQWDGNNYVGTLDDDAQEAEAEAEAMCAAVVEDVDNMVSSGGVGDYCEWMTWDECWPAGVTLEHAAAAIVEKASADDYLLEDDVDDVAEWLVNEATRHEGELTAEQRAELIARDMLDAE